MLQSDVIRLERNHSHSDLISGSRWFVFRNSLIEAFCRLENFDGFMKTVA